MITVLGFSFAAMLLGWWMFGGVQLARPGLGVFSLADLVVMIAAIVLVPLVYVSAPTLLVSSLLLLAGASSLHILLGSCIKSDRITSCACSMPHGG